MKITATQRANLNFIRGYAPGEIRIGEQSIHSNCLVTANQLITDWQANDAATLSLAHLEPMLALKPEIVVLGTGERQQFPPAEIYAALLSRRIGFEVMDLGAACRTFNVLLSEDRSVLAALLLK